MVISSDVIEYYSYLPATFIYHDLTLKFKETDPDYFFNKVWGQKLENGNYVIKVSMGQAILYSPFFFLGHILAHASSYPEDGYSVPYAAGLTLSSLVYFLLGLILLRKFLLKYFSELTVTLILFVLSLGTNITMYLTMVPAFPHSYNIFLFSAFLLLTDRWHEKPGYINSILLGLVAGLIALLRPTNSILIIVFILWNIQEMKDLTVRVKTFLTNRKFIALIVIFCILVWVPQFIYWKIITGHLFYYSYGEEGFFFLHPKIWKVLFSFRKGWLLYTPVMAVACIGFIYLFRMYRKLFPGIAIFFILNLYIISSWWCWWFGGSYGHRAFIDSYALMALPLGAFIQHFTVKSIRNKIAVIVLFLFLVFHNIFQTVQYSNTAIHWDSMSKLAYFETFGKLNATTLFFDLLEPPDVENALKGLPERTQPLIFTNLKNILTMESMMQGREYLQLFYEDFEHQDATHNEDFSKYLNRSVSRSCNTSYALNSEQMYLPGYQINLMELNNEHYSYIAADYYIYTSDTIAHNGLGLVMSVEDRDICSVYHFEPADRFPLKENTWNLRHFIIQCPITSNNDAIFKCYIWNIDGKSRGYIDDLRVYGIR